MNDLSDLARDPLFQLNLMIWLSWPPSPSIRNPIFQKKGFELLYLGLTLSVPPAATLRAKNHIPSVPLGLSPRPDLLLYSRGTSHFIPLECKATSFSMSSIEKVTQAGSLLACTGKEIAQSMGYDTAVNWKSSVIYAVSHPNHSRMQATLDNVRQGLHSADIPMAAEPPTSLGIEVSQQAISLHFADVSRLPFAQTHDQVKVIDVKPGQDPRSLYVLCLDPSLSSSQDPYAETMFQERVRTSFAVQVGAQVQRAVQQDQSFATVRWEDIVKDAVLVWECMRDNDDRRALIAHVKSHFGRALRELGKHGMQVDTSNPTSFTVSPTDAAGVKRIHTFLQSPAYRKLDFHLGQSGQPSLFDQTV